MPQALEPRRRRRRGLCALGLCALGLWALLAGGPSAGAAQASSGVSLRPSFLPDRLGAGTALTLALRISGGEEGVPAALRRLTLRLPAGLSLSLNGVASCPLSALRARGPRGCPASSLIGRGHGLTLTRAGSQLISEETSLSAYRGPNRGGLPTFSLLARGQTPLQESTLSQALAEPDSAPFGLRLSVSVPPIPTLTFEPDASFASLSLTIGGAGGTPRAHAAGATVRIPRRCPAGGFPFAVLATFADRSSARATSTIPCP